MTALPDLSFEKQFWQAGISKVAGIDEAGRGALAGPVAAAAVVLPPAHDLPRTLHGVRDSKQMSSKKREYWAVRIKATAASWAVGFSSPDEIDRIGIVPATRLAALRAIEQLTILPDFLLIDYLILTTCDIPQTALVKGDQKCLSIASASILAKTTRDAVMRESAKDHPGYGFERHKGYGTPQHKRAIQRLGICSIHRQSFSLNNKKG